MNPQDVPQAVGFRLSPHYASVLEKKATARGISPHAYARLVLISDLEDSERESLRDLARASVEEIRVLRSEFHAALSQQNPSS